MARAAIQNVEPICCECGKLAVQVDGSRIWPHRRDLFDKVMWLCECGAYVGSHDGTEIPLGYPGNMRTREMRSMAHREFDFIWKVKVERDKVSNGVARQAAYEWLAGQLGIEVAACHMAHFNEARARQAWEICRRVAEKIRRSQQAVRST